MYCPISTGLRAEMMKSRKTKTAFNETKTAKEPDISDGDLIRGRHRSGGLSQKSSETEPTSPVSPRGKHCTRDKDLCSRQQDEGGLALDLPRGAERSRREQREKGHTRV